ncbi:MAG: threonine--tRNA ligase [Legionellales bacterium]|nr:threonine--tRNA ligase [Legionellales bacterium]
MINIQILDSGIHQVSPGTLITELVKSLKLKEIVAARINDQLVDLATPLIEDSDVYLIPASSDEGLEIIRHSTAHLMAHAVKELYPSAQVTIGPVIENGFYYDFSYAQGFTPDDMAKIERKMKQIAKKNDRITREVMDRKEAITLFESMGEHYKAQIISDIDSQETLTLYRQGDFVDLCRGPHVPSTLNLKAFKLMKLAGAYWRGDEKNEMLQRIYGTAWATQDELEYHLNQLEEAEKRDHRKLAKAMDLFHFQDIAPGMVFWHHNGLKIYQSVVDYMRLCMKQKDYQEISTPMIMDQSLWQASGHWDKFRDNMFITETEDKTFCVKPMNCPGGLQVYNMGLKSYRDLPLKIGEFGFVHRNEVSGALQGLMRLRAFTQDDAHVFCTEEQLQHEVIQLIDLVYNTYLDFGFDSIIVLIATRPDKRIGSDNVWDLGEQALIEACESKSIDFEMAPGEGAFYGPKIEFHLKDCIGRKWQCGTIQVDYSMPERLHAHFINSEGNKEVPIMIHRAIFGSIERFVGVLIEHYSGCLPLWIAPIQIMVVAVSDQFSEYAEDVFTELKGNDFSVEIDRRDEKLGYKIRHATLRKIPYLVIIGEKEVNNQSVSIRCVNGTQMNDLKLDVFIQSIQNEIETKAKPNEKFEYGLVQNVKD